MFLFASSVPQQDRAFANALLEQAQAALRNDPTITMELGYGVEAGGVYASQRTQYVSENEGVNYDQLVLQFQIEGGNAWAQGVAYGIRPYSSDGPGSDDKDTTTSNVQLVSLEVANMDASLNGTPFEVNIPLPTTARSDSDNDEKESRREQ